MAANLLEIGELADLHAITPDLPAKPPRAKSGAFPVILNKADVVQVHVDADCLKRPQIQLLQVRWRRFDQHLILVIVLEPVWVLTVAPISRAA